MLKLLVFGDLHISDKPPAGRVDDYMQALLGKLESIGKLCEKYKVSWAIGIGDIYHVKQANRVSHSLNRQLSKAFKAFPCDTLVLPGNHDCSSSGVESLPEQPLGMLEEAEAVHILRQTTLYGDLAERESFWLVPRPYSAIAEGVHDGEVNPSYYSLTEEEQEIIAQNPQPIIGVVHGSLLAPGDSRPYPYVNVDQIPGIEQYALLVSGHLHECLGVVKVGKTLFANPGSIGRTRRDLASYARTVEVLVVTVDEKGVSVEEVPLPGVAPALEVFGNREADDTPDAPSDEIAQFVAGLGEGVRADRLSIPELLAELGGIPPEVKAEVQRLLEESAT